MRSGRSSAPRRTRTDISRLKRTLLLPIELEAPAQCRTGSPCVTMLRMAETIWSIIALVGAIIMVSVIAYFIATGRDDRERD